MALPSATVGPVSMLPGDILASVPAPGSLPGCAILNHQGGPVPPVQLCSALSRPNLQDLLCLPVH